MFAAALTLALFGLVLTWVIDVVRSDGAKILAALEGRSWAAGPTGGRTVTIRFGSADGNRTPATRPVLRAAA